MSITEGIKNSPWGLKIIILLFGIEMIRSLVEVAHGPESYKVFNCFIAILFFIGFILRWETVRFFWRLISGASFFITFFYVVLGSQFDFKQKTLATVSLCIAGTMFIYLGLPHIRTLFK